MWSRSNVVSRPYFEAFSARAERCAERTDEKVAAARTSVPTVVAAVAAVVVQSLTEGFCHLDRLESPEV